MRVSWTNMIFRTAFAFVFLLAASNQSTAATGDLLHLVRQYEHQVLASRPWNYPFDGNFFFGSERVEEHAGPGPAPYRLVQIDAVSGRKTVVLDSLPRAIHLRFFLKDYVVVGDGIYNRTSLYDRKSFRRLGSKRLSDNVRDAIVDGNTLLLLQGNRKNYVLSKFALPSMRFLGESHPGLLQGLRTVKFWKNRILGVRRARCAKRPCPLEAVVSSLEGTPIATIPLETERRPGRSCAPVIEEIVGSRAVIRAGCGQYKLVDLASREVLYELPQDVDADFYDIVISQDLLFARAEKRMRPASKGGQGDPVRILDLESGQELGLVSLPKGKMLWSQGRLILKRLHAHSVLEIAVYRIDRKALQTDDHRTQKIMSAAQDARAGANVYAAIGTIEAVSLEPLLGRSPSQMDEDLFAIATDYGRYLAANPRRVEEGADLLVRLSAARPENRQLARLSDVAAQRALLFDADPMVRENTLTDAWTSRSHRPLARSIIRATTVEFGAFSDVIYFHEGRVFVACWRCRKSSLVSVEVYDRETWAHIASLPIIHADGEKQEGISGMAFESGRLFVSLGNRYPKVSDINFHIFDLETLAQIEERTIIENGATLISGDGVLGVCDCRARYCRAIDAVRLSEVDIELAHEAVCVNQHRPRADIDWRFAQSGLVAGKRVFFAGSGYFINSVGAWPNHVFEFYPTDREGQPVGFPRPINHLGSRDIYFLESGERVLIGEKSFDTIRYHMFDLRSQQAQTQIELPRHDYKGAAADGRALFAAFGRTVLAIDMNSGDILDWGDPFDDGSTVEPGTAPKAIHRLLVDRGKLIVLGQDGPTRIVDLQRFHALSKPNGTPFSATRKGLVD